MTRYLTDLSRDLRQAIQDAQEGKHSPRLPDGWRLAERQGTALDFDLTERWAVEDGNAPPELEGHLVTPRMSVHSPLLDDSFVLIDGYDDLGLVTA